MASPLLCLRKQFGANGAFVKGAVMRRCVEFVIGGGVALLA